MSDWMTRRAVIACIFLVGFCIYMSYKELRYVAWGRTVDAAILDAKEVQLKKGNGPTIPGLRVEYEFEDGDQIRTEMEHVDPRWPVAKGATTIPIEYIPGTTTSRLKGNDHKGWLWGSGVLVVIVGLMGALWWKYRNAEAH